MMHDTQFLIRIPAILIALTVHEYCHGYVAWLKGDNTAKQAGRLTLNPLSHLDLFGTLMLLFGPFGWAKPVPVNSMDLDNPYRDMRYVSAAGPLSNIVLALIMGFIYRFLFMSGVIQNPPPYLIYFFKISIIINLGLSFFNLLPIPPLDGSHIFLSFLHPSKRGTYYRYVRHAPKIFVIMLLIEWGLHIPVFSYVIYPLWRPYAGFWQFIIFGGKVL